MTNLNVGERWREQFDEKWFVPGGDTTGKSDGDYWFYQAINGDDPSGEMKDFISSLLAAQMEEVAAEIKKMEIKGVHWRGDNLPYSIVDVDEVLTLLQSRRGELNQ